MLVHPVVIPGSGTRSWTVLGDDDVPVVPVERFLAYLTGIGRSPNTVKAYAHDLKDYWCFMGFRGLDWREARLEDIGEFVVWLRLPPSGRAGEVAVLPSVTAQVTASTVNRKLAAVSAFYAHHARDDGGGVGDLLAAWRTGGRGGWKPFLHHVSKGKPLGLDDVTEAASANGASVYLHARGVRNSVWVSVTATVFEDGEEIR